MDWYLIVLAVVFGIPVILLPVALVWYLNISGLYQVMRDARKRQRRRVEAFREAERLTKTPVAAAPKEGALARKG